MTIDPKIAARLRALAELAERGSENEAEVAATRLAELMAKHQIESLDFDAPVERIAVEDGRLDADEGDPPSRVENWERTLLAAVAEVCGGRAWLRGRGRYQQMRMYGPPGSTGAARYLYTWLRRQVGDFARVAARAHGETNAWRRSYALGMVTRVYQRMTQARAAVFDGAGSVALAVVDRQRQAVDRRVEEADLTPIRSGQRKRPDATSWGFHDGDRVDIGSSDRATLGEGPKRLKE